MRAFVLAGSILAVLLAAGCASSTPDQPDESTTRSSPTTITPKTAPVSAFTEVVAEYKPQLEKAAANGQTACLKARESAECQDAYSLFSTIASNFHGDLLAVHGAGTATYQGAPPQEISSLLNDTEALASRATRMADTYTASTCPDIVFDCGKEKVWAQLAAGELVQKLAAWDAHM